MDKIFSHLFLERVLARQIEQRTLKVKENSNLAASPKTKISKKIGWGVMFLLALLLFVIASRYLTFNPDVYFPEQKEVYIAHTAFLLMHIIGSMLAILIGPFQFLQRVRTGRFLTLHRWLGRVYLLGILFGGFGGLYMAQLAYGGLVSKLGFTALAILWLSSGFMAYKSIRKKQIEVHRKWMTVNYALTFAGVMLRLWLPLFTSIGVDFVAAYRIIAWLCWVPNLIVAQQLISKIDSADKIY